MKLPAISVRAVKTVEIRRPSKLQEEEEEGAVPKTSCTAHGIQDDWDVHARTI